jgi:DNA invertase Pin-like site-specific DNA recombinase
MRKPVAYSYVRFSTPDQAKGDSLRRQTEAAEAYCQRHGLTLDGSLKADEGVSAYRGRNAAQGHLRAFLDKIGAGAVKPGDLLIVESVDRISRQGIDEGYDLCKRILKAGVHIVTLSPERNYGPDAVKGLARGALELLLILERAHEESATKSNRNNAAWETARRRAREGVVTARRLPGWIEKRDGKLCLIPERARTLRLIYELAASGYGMTHITQELTKRGAPTFGPSGRWLKGYVALLLKDRRAVGEFQPLHKDKRPAGDPIRSFFPAVVSEELWLAARAGATQRRRRMGRVNGFVNIFAGLLVDALTSEPYYTTRRVNWGKPHRVLTTKTGSQGQGPCRSFPLDTFERLFIVLLREVNPSDLLPAAAGVDTAAVLEGEIEGVRERIAALQKELLSGDVSAVVQVLRQLEARERELAAELEAERVKRAHPLSHAWEGVRLSAKTDDERFRWRKALRRIIDKIYVVAVNRGRDRVAFVQAWFQGGETGRTWVMLHRPPLANASVRRDGERRTWSLRNEKWGGRLDLRRQDHARRAEEYLRGDGFAELLAGP